MRSRARSPIKWRNEKLTRIISLVRLFRTSIYGRLHASMNFKISIDYACLFRCKCVQQIASHQMDGWYKHVGMHVVYLTCIHRLINTFESKIWMLNKQVTFFFCITDTMYLCVMCYVFTFYQIFYTYVKSGNGNFFILLLLLFLFSIHHSWQIII